jgi:hypothetical protein
MESALVIGPCIRRVLVGFDFVACEQRLRFSKYPPARDDAPYGRCVGNIIQRVRIEQHDIRQLAWLEAAQRIARSHPLGAVLSRDAQDLDRWVARPRQILQFGLECLAIVVAVFYAISRLDFLTTTSRTFTVDHLCDAFRRTYFGGT